eukprot:gene4673-9267_t
MSDSSSDYGLDDCEPISNKSNNNNQNNSQKNSIPVTKQPPIKSAMEDHDLGSGDSYSSLGALSQEDGSIVGDWLEEKDDEKVEDQYDFEENIPPNPEAEISAEPLDPYILEFKELYDAIICVSDLRFTSLSTTHQAELLATLIEESYEPGEVIFEKDSEEGDLYFITGPPDAQVEVIRTVDDVPKLLTRLGVSQYFGQKNFISNRMMRRNATVRAITHAKVAVLTPEHFLKWNHFRTFLLMKEVPMFRTLPHAEQLHLYSQLQHQEFNDGEYIVRQGDVGDKFYMITEGAVDVVEERVSESGGRTMEVLVRLYEGHFFGEMALIYDEPRVASVLAVGRTSCLYLTTVAFREALSAQQFHIMMQEISYKRVLMREQRKITREMTVVKKMEEDDDMSVESGESELNRRGSGVFDDTNGSETSNGSQKVTTTNKLVRSRLSTGDRLINKYLVIKEIGRGTSGDVYLCKNEENGHPTNRWSQSAASEIEKEINIMKSLRHPNVVSLLEVIDDPNVKQVFLIQEYMQGGPILPGDLVTEPIPSDIARRYFRDMLKGIRYLHHQGIVHRDIKPQNMLRTADDTVKIADFGAAVFTGHGNGNEVLAAGGTPAFMAPEMFLIGTPGYDNKDIVNSPKVDVWSLGITLFNMIAGRPPFLASNQIELAAKIQNIELSYPEELLPLVDPHLRHLISRMLDKDWKSRFDMDQVIEHDWVTSEGSYPLEDPLVNDSMLFIPIDLKASEDGLDLSSLTEKSNRRASGQFRKIRTDFLELNSDTDSLFDKTSKSRRNSVNSDLSHRSLNDRSGRNSPIAKHGVPVFDKSEFDKSASNVLYVGAKDIAAPTPEEFSGKLGSGSRSDSGPAGGGGGAARTLQRTTDFVMVPSELVLGPTGEKVKKTIIFTSPNYDPITTTNESGDVRPPKGGSLRRSNNNNNGPQRNNKLLRSNASFLKHGNLTMSSSMRSNASDASSSSKESSKGGSSYADSSKIVSPQKESGGKQRRSSMFNSLLSLQEYPQSVGSGSGNGENGNGNSNGGGKSGDDLSVNGENDDSEDEGDVIVIATRNSITDLAGAQTLDDNGMMSVFDDLCATPADKFRGADPHLSVPVIENLQELQMLKTWAGQWNLRLGVSIVDRDYMEDRTWTTASYAELSRRKPSGCGLASSDSTASISLSNPDPSSEPVLTTEMTYDNNGNNINGNSRQDEVNSPDFAFFGIFDGHNGHYVSEALQSSLYQLFRLRWEEAEELARMSTDPGVRGETLGERALRCITSACAQLDRAILGHDYEKQRLLQEDRKDSTDEMPTKKASHIKETLSFAEIYIDLNIANLLDHVGTSKLDPVVVVNKIPPNANANANIPHLRQRLLRILRQTDFQVFLHERSNAVLSVDTVELLRTLNHKQRRAIKVDPMQSKCLSCGRPLVLGPGTGPAGHNNITNSNNNILFLHAGNGILGEGAVRNLDPQIWSSLESHHHHFHHLKVDKTKNAVVFSSKHVFHQTCLEAIQNKNNSNNESSNSNSSSTTTVK